MRIAILCWQLTRCRGIRRHFRLLNRGSTAASSFSAHAFSPKHMSPIASDCSSGALSHSTVNKPVPCAKPLQPISSLRYFNCNKASDCCSLLATYWSKCSAISISSLCSCVPSCILVVLSSISCSDCAIVKQCSKPYWYWVRWVLQQRVDSQTRFCSLRRRPHQTS
jgi:hypothetical protein